MLAKLTNATVGNGKVVHYVLNGHITHTLCGVPSYKTSPLKLTSKEVTCKSCLASTELAARQALKEE